MKGSKDRRLVARVRRELAAGRDRNEIFTELKGKGRGAQFADQVIRAAQVKP